jgi:hypothetical protein
MGAVLLLGILPIKLARIEHHGASSFAIGVAPSILGSAGLLFLLLSSSGWPARLSLLRVALLVTALSVTLELLQLLPRPGVLARVRYTFDAYDLAATVFGVAMAYAVSAWILRPSPEVVE